MTLIEMAIKAKKAAKAVALLNDADKNQALIKMSEALLEKSSEIKAANEIDMENGRKMELSNALLDRLLLTDERIQAMAEGLVDLAKLADPIGDIDEVWHNHAGLEIAQVRVPLGVIAMIYEARPNVTVDAAGLCLKSGNVVILRGSKSALESNIAIVRILQEALVETAIPVEAVQLVEDVRYETINELLRMSEFVDLAIPRGGAKLIQSVRENAAVPVIATGTGNCHLYVDEYADLAKAEAILINGKVQRPGVCNATETLLVHQAVAEQFLAKAIKRLQDLGVEIRGCQKTKQFVNDVIEATEEDYRQEYADLILAVRVVEDYDSAVAHINEYGTGHSEVIVSEQYSRTRDFIRRIDAACVYVNASSRFSDGAEFGFGAEIGISTQKMHARGPMGIRALTSYKYTILGEGQVRS